MVVCNDPKWDSLGDTRQKRIHADVTKLSCSCSNLIHNLNTSWLDDYFGIKTPLVENPIVKSSEKRGSIYGAYSSDRDRCGYRRN